MEQVRALRDPGAGDSRAAAARADRARAQARRERAKRPPRAHRGAACDPLRTRRRSTASSNRSCSPSATIYGSHDDRRTEILAADDELDRGPSRRRGHGDRDHAVRLHQAPARHRVPEQRRGGIGVGHGLKDEDFVEHLFVASTHDYVLFFTSVGKVYRLKVHELRSALASRRAGRSSTCCRSGRTRSVPSSRRATSRNRSTWSSPPRRRGQEDQVPPTTTPR